MQFFKGNRKNKKAVPQPSQPAPRSLEEINKDYNTLCAQLGQTQYQKAVLEERVSALNRQLSNIASEANARNEIDSKLAEAAKSSAPQEQPAEQSQAV